MFAHRAWHLVPLLFVSVLLLCGCTETVEPGKRHIVSPDLLEQQLLHRAVVRLRHHETDGSAIVLGGGRFLTDRHLLPEYAFGAPLGSTSVLAYINEKRAMYRVVECGTTASTVMEDWALIEIVEGESSLLQLSAPYAIECEHDVSLDSTVFLVGHWTPHNSQRGSATVVRGCVVPLPQWAHGIVSPSAICIDTRWGETLHGHSGGAIIKVQPDGSFAVVGLYRGGLQRSALGVTTDCMQLARSIPALSKS